MFVTAIREWAIAHYNRDGWDFLVECWEDKDIYEVIRGCRTPRSAIEKCRKALKPMAEKRRSVMNEVF